MAAAITEEQLREVLAKVAHLAGQVAELDRRIDRVAKVLNDRRSSDEVKKAES